MQKVKISPHLSIYFLPKIKTIQNFHPLRLCCFSLLETGLIWLKTKQKSYIINSKRPPEPPVTFIFSCRMTSMGHLAGHMIDTGQQLGVLLNFNIWFNSAVSETVYLFTTARDQWATFYERPCVLSSLSTVKGCAHSRSSEELWVSQPLGMWEEWLIHFQLRWTWIWIAEFELCPPSCPT